MIWKQRLAFVALALAVTAAACTSGDGDDSTTSSETASSAATEAQTDATEPAGSEATEASGEAASTGEPQAGGTLLVAGGPDVLFLDPAAAYSKADYQIQRAIHRGLFDYVPSTDLTEATTPVADIATEVPTLDNGGISEDGLTYTITLRDGVTWNAPSGERPVVADDVVRAFKRMCNPVQGAYPRKYYTDTVVGFEEYCSGMAEVDPTIEGIRQYVEEGGDIEGVQALDDSTLEFTLTQPAEDFVQILALSRFAAPQPEE